MQLKGGSRVVLALTALIVAPLVQAHTVTTQPLGLIPGIMHPLTGADHVMAALATGMWVAVSGGTPGRSVIAAFLGMLGLGAIAGFTGASMPLVEPVIALSVIAFGVLIALRAPLSGVMGSAIAGGFALFHGYAHAAGLPVTAGSGWYLLGLLMASTLLLGSGVMLGRGLTAAESRLPLQLAGGFFALIGSMLLAYA